MIERPERRGTRLLWAWLWRGLVAVPALGLLLGTGCHRENGRVLGHPPAGVPQTILAVKAGDTPPEVTLSGALIQKCPVAGCWFYLRDRTGTIKVNTRSAGFVVVDVPLETKAVVAGRVIASGDAVEIEATGLRY